MVRHTGEHFIDIEGVAVTSMLSLQPARINGYKFDAPEPDRLSINGDSALGQHIFDGTLAQVESVIQPDRLGKDIWRKSVAFIDIHGPILATSAR